MSNKVAGFCPFGCGAKLVLRVGRVVCDGQSCPRPLAVHEIISDPETAHLVEVGTETFGLQHPLRERVDRNLFNCDLYERLRALDGPPVVPGMYRTVDGTTFEDA